MPALLINIKIDLREKFDLFKVTLSDLSGLFEECHIKIRGKYSQEGVEYARSQLGIGIHLYQNLQESDWVATTLEILREVESRSVFLFFEDHKLVAGRQRLEQTLADFDKWDLDYLCYSFFKASQLDANNLLPLGVEQHALFHEFSLSEHNLGLIGKISPYYFTFSLVSLVSVEYFRELLAAENKRIKLFGRNVIAVLTRLFPYLHYRRVIKTVNDTLSWFSTRLCEYPPSSPFNLEKIWYESITINRDWKFGILRQELFANYDDDNGAYGESLMKKGSYPLEAHSIDAETAGSLNTAVCSTTLSDGESFDCTYYSHNGRIRRAPLVEISVIRGSVRVHYQGTAFPLSSGEGKTFYSNLSPVVHCIEFAEIEIKVFDEVFK